MKRAAPQRGDRHQRDQREIVLRKSGRVVKNRRPQQPHRTQPAPPETVRQHTEKGLRKRTHQRVGHPTQPDLGVRNVEWHRQNRQNHRDRSIQNIDRHMAERNRAEPPEIHLLIPRRGGKPVYYAKNFPRYLAQFYQHLRPTSKLSQTCRGRPCACPPPLRVTLSFTPSPPCRGNPCACPRTTVTRIKSAMSAPLHHGCRHDRARRIDGRTRAGREILLQPAFHRTRRVHCAVAVG